MKTLFLAVSTENNIANLPPILEMASPGDEVAWIESPRARQEKWSSGASSVLVSFGIRTMKPIQVMNLYDPSSISKNVSTYLKELEKDYDKIAVVLNGGPKLTPIGLLLAIGGTTFKKIEWLYGFERPVHMWIFKNGLSTSPEIKKYKHHKLDLEHILACRSFQLQDADKARKIWPTDIAPSIFTQYADKISIYTNLFETHRQKIEKSKSNESNDQTRFINREEWAERAMPILKELAGKVKERERRANIALLFKEAINDESYDILERQKQYDEWSKAVDVVIARLKKKSGTGIRINKQLGVLRSTAIKIFTKETWQMKRRQFDNNATGIAFELAVLSRVYEWLKSKPSFADCVQSAWYRVQIVPKDMPNRTHQEFDVLLVLKNGILLHLECKSYKADEKDLTARFFKLRLSSSSLARMCVVIPLVAEVPFNSQLKTNLLIYENLMRIKGLPVLTFDIPGQPRKVTLSDGKKVEIIPFEKQLENLLRPYSKA